MSWESHRGEEDASAQTGVETGDGAMMVGLQYVGHGWTSWTKYRPREDLMSLLCTCGASPRLKHQLCKKAKKKRQRGVQAADMQ